MRTNYGLVNETISDEYKMIAGVKYLWYVQEDGTQIGQGYFIESNAKDKKHSERKIRKMIESNSEFLHWK